MMKKFSKKAMLGIIAGVLAAFAIIGAGTFAWFTSSTDTDITADFTAATVKVSVEDLNDVGFFNFLKDGSTTNYATQNQANLEFYLDQCVEQYERDRTLADWWVAEFANDFDVLDSYNSSTEFVTPGSLLCANYKIVNDSNVPVYYRIKADAIKVTDSLDVEIWDGKFAYIIYSEASGALLEYYDGYYYSKTPIDDTFNGRIIIETYIMGSNDNNLQGAIISFDGGAVDFIQADNNAVFIETTWKDAAYALGF